MMMGAGGGGALGHGCPVHFVNLANCASLYVMELNVSEEIT